MGGSARLLQELMEQIHELEFEVERVRHAKVQRPGARARWAPHPKNPRWLIAYKFEAL